MLDDEEPPSPLEKRFSLDEVILGMISDLEALRAGTISIQDGRVRAEMAKQVLNGVRLVINAQRFLETRAISLPPAESEA